MGKGWVVMLQATECKFGVCYSSLCSMCCAPAWTEYFEGLEPKGAICIFGKNEVLVSKRSFQHREPFFMLTNTYNTSMAWYHQKMVGLSALCHNLFRAKRSHLADRTMWTNQNQFHKALVSFTSIYLVPKGPIWALFAHAVLDNIFTFIMLKHWNRL